LVLVVFLILIITIVFGVYFSKIKINIRSVEMESEFKNAKLKFDIKLGLFLFGKIKVLNFNLYEDGIRFLNGKISYKEFKDRIYKIFRIESKNRDIKNDFEKYIKTFKKINPKLEELDLKINIRFEDVFLTSFSIVAISTILSFFAKGNKYMYRVLSYCERKRNVDLKGKCVISIKTINVLNN